MRVVPKSDIEMIEWFRLRFTAWQDAARELHLSDEQIASLEAALENAEQHRAEFEALRVQMDAAAMRAHESAATLRRTGGPLVKIIRSNAELASNPGAIYSTAAIPRPSGPTESEALPVTPERVRAQLTNNGTIQITWRNRERRRGVYFQIERATTGLNQPGEPFMPIGVTASRSFIDTAAPRGVATVSYRIRAARLNTIGCPSNPALITYGSPLGAIGSTQDSASKKAA